MCSAASAVYGGCFFYMYAVAGIFHLALDTPPVQLMSVASMNATDVVNLVFGDFDFDGDEVLKSESVVFECGFFEL